MGIVQLAAKGYYAGIVVKSSRRWASGMFDGQPGMAALPAAAWEQNGMITSALRSMNKALVLL